MRIRNARPVLRDVVQQGQLLRAGQPARRHGAVGDDPGGQGAERAGDEAQHDEHGAPAGQRRGGRDRLEAEGHEAADDLRDAQPAVPQAEARRLLRARVPLRRHQHQAGRDRRLEDAQEGPRHDERRVVVRRGGAGRRDAPEEDVQAEPFARGDLLQDVACGWARGVAC